MDWFLYDNGLRHETVKTMRQLLTLRSLSFRVIFEETGITGTKCDINPVLSTF